MSDLNKILSDISQRKFKPVYLLYGDEPFFIDQISKAIEDTVLDEAERGFNQMVFYGKDSKVEEIVECAKRFPMMAPYQVIIVKEAQHLSSKMDGMSQYMAQPSETTILVLCYKYKKPDNRLKVFKNMKKHGLFFESKPLYENKMPQWINGMLQSKGYRIEPKATQMLVEFLGTDLGRIKNEIDKLAIVQDKTAPITPQTIEDNIGFSKDYNNFELRNAIGRRDALKTHRIINYFGENPKDNPLVLTVATLHSYFVQLLKIHGVKDHSKNNVARVVGINPYFVDELLIGVRNYTMKDCSRAVSLIRELDLKTKGMGAYQVSHADLLKESMVKIMVH